MAVSVIESGAVFGWRNGLSHRALRLGEPVYRARRENSGFARREMGCLAMPNDGCFTESASGPFGTGRIGWFGGGGRSEFGEALEAIA
jgi:hypothetical protein